ncbi:hypothetical protein L1887_50603 [Cichorium endivia]|nr:hypothetical protein L1887_50603 [Cichorium endivia]
MPHCMCSTHATEPAHRFVGLANPHEGHARSPGRVEDAWQTVVHRRRSRLGQPRPCVVQRAALGSLFSAKRTAWQAIPNLRLPLDPTLLPHRPLPRDRSFLGPRKLLGSCFARAHPLNRAPVSKWKVSYFHALSLAIGPHPIPPLCGSSVSCCLSTFPRPDSARAFDMAWLVHVHRCLSPLGPSIRCAMEYALPVATWCALSAAIVRQIPAARIVAVEPWNSRKIAKCIRRSSQHPRSVQPSSLQV